LCPVYILPEINQCLLFMRWSESLRYKAQGHYLKCLRSRVLGFGFWVLGLRFRV